MKRFTYYCVSAVWINFKPCRAKIDVVTVMGKTYWDADEKVDRKWRKQHSRNTKRQLWAVCHTLAQTKRMVGMARRNTVNLTNQKIVVN